MKYVTREVGLSAENMLGFTLCDLRLKCLLTLPEKTPGNTSEKHRAQQVYMQKFKRHPKRYIDEKRLTRSQTPRK